MLPLQEFHHMCHPPQAQPVCLIDSWYTYNIFFVNLPAEEEEEKEKEEEEEEEEGTGQGRGKIDEGENDLNI